MEFGLLGYADRELMRRLGLKRGELIAAALLAGVSLAACDNGEGVVLPTTSTVRQSTGEARVVEDVVGAALQAQKDKDADVFVALWTDKGLESYDVGTRAELE